MATFSIITPTYKKADKLTRAIRSVFEQANQNFTMIIVNDSPDDASYASLEQGLLLDTRIRYVKNEKNMGANFSRNRGISMADEDSWIIFLDDDDYLANEALLTFETLIEKHSKEHWFIANRADESGISYTRIVPDKAHLEYAWNFLILRKFSGDATHCIRASFAKKILFPMHIRQGDEWIFFYELGTKTGFYYTNYNATLTDGYDASGLNFRARSTHTQLHTLRLLWNEGASRGLLSKPSFLIYMAMRFVRAFVK